MVSEDDRTHEKSPVTKMQSFEEMTKTPGKEKTTTSTPNVQTVEKETIRNETQTTTNAAQEDHESVKEYEAFKRFQAAQKSYEEAKGKKVDATISKQYHPHSSEDERPRKKTKGKKKVRWESSEEEYESSPKKSKDKKKKVVVLSEESEDDKPRRKKAGRNMAESSEDSGKGQWKRIKIPKIMGATKRRKKKGQDRYLTPEAREARRYNREFEKLNFRSPFTDDINETPVPKGLIGPRIKMYDGTGDPDDHVSNFQ